MVMMNPVNLSLLALLMGAIMIIIAIQGRERTPQKYQMGVITFLTFLFGGFSLISMGLLILRNI